jgi:CIC family chloride channel protein
MGVATFVVGHRTIYRSQLPTRADSPANRFRFALPLLAAVPVGEAVRRARLVIGPHDTAAAALQAMVREGVDGAPIVSGDGAVIGVVDRAVIAHAPPGDRAAHHADANAPILREDDGLDEALGELADSHREWAPVEREGQLTGVLSVRDAMTAYRSALSGNVRRVRGLRSEGVIIEAEVVPSSALAGQAVAGIAWPRDSLLVSVERGERVLVPRGDLELHPGDRLSVFASPAASEAIRALFHDPAA